MKPQLAAEVDALRPVFDALRRGTKRSRLRLLVYVCERGHTLLEVFPTAAGPYAVWREHGGRRGPGTYLAVPIPPAPILDSYGARPACHCSASLDVATDEIRADLDRGRRRVPQPFTGPRTVAFKD